jgi:hypothetical protein
MRPSVVSSTQEGTHVDEERPEGIDRRKMLKGIGAGAAIAWAVPTVVTATGAFGSAVGSAPAICRADNEYVCGGAVGECPPANGGSCQCYLTTEGYHFCGDNTSCADNCASSSDCSPGSYCVSNSTQCCGQDGYGGGVCIALCQGGLSPDALKAGPTTGGPR